MVFLFCATSFGVVLTLGGLRYSSVETEIYLLTTQLLDLRAAAALSIVQLLAITALLILAARLRAVPDPTVERRTARPRRPRRQDAAQLAVTALVLALVAAPILTLLVGSLRVDDAWSLANYRRLTRSATATRCWCPVTDALVTSLRTAVDATWMSLLLGGLIAVVVSRRSHDQGRASAARHARRLLHAAARGLRGDAGLRLPDHPRPPAAGPAGLAAAGPRRTGAGRAAAGGAHPGARAQRHRRPPAPGRGVPGCRPAARLRDRRPPGRVAAAAGRGGLRVRGLARRVRRHVVPRPRRAPDPAGRDLPADRSSRQRELRHGPGRLGRARRRDRAGRARWSSGSASGRWASSDARAHRRLRVLRRRPGRPRRDPRPARRPGAGGARPVRLRQVDPAARGRRARAARGRLGGLGRRATSRGRPPTSAASR